MRAGISFSPLPLLRVWSEAGGLWASAAGPRAAQSQVLLQAEPFPRYPCCHRPCVSAKGTRALCLQCCSWWHQFTAWLKGFFSTFSPVSSITLSQLSCMSNNFVFFLCLHLCCLLVNVYAAQSEADSASVQVYYSFSFINLLKWLVAGESLFQSTQSLVLWCVCARSPQLWALPGTKVVYLCITCSHNWHEPFVCSFDLIFVAFETFMFQIKQAEPCSSRSFG